MREVSSSTVARFWSCLLVSGFCLDFQVGAGETDFAAARARMVEQQLSAPGRDITNRRVLTVLGEVPRHEFVPAALRVQAYDDHPLPIGYDQTISQPFIVAFMTEKLEPKPKDKVLEIGTGSGYQAAVLAKVAGEVYSIEILPRLSERAKTILKHLGLDNVHLKVGDGFFGWEEQAPFDAILVTAAARKVPEPLWRQLREGGRLIMPLGEGRESQKLVRVTKSEGRQLIEEVAGVVFVPLTGAIRDDRR